MLFRLFNESELMIDRQGCYVVLLTNLLLGYIQVNSLSKLAQGTPTQDPNTVVLAQNIALKASSLQVR